MTDQPAPRKLNTITWTLKDFKLSDLTEYDKNPRQLSESEYKQLKKSLDKFGLIDKPIVNLDDAHTIIGGHQRVHVMQHEGVTSVSCWIPSRPLTDREVEELNIRLNKNIGKWDMDVLANSWDVPDLLEWGFQGYELGMVGEPNDPSKEWQGMPEFEQEDQKSFRHIIIHFDNQEDIDKFAKLINQTITNKSKWLWFPYKAHADLKSLEYKSEP